MQSTIWKLTVLLAVIGVGFVAVMQAQRSLPLAENSAGDAEQTAGETNGDADESASPDGQTADAMSAAEPPAQAEPSAASGGQYREPRPLPQQEPTPVAAAEQEAAPPQFAQSEPQEIQPVAGRAVRPQSRGLDFRAEEPLRFADATEEPAPAQNDNQSDSPFGPYGAGATVPVRSSGNQPAEPADFGSEPTPAPLQAGAAPQLLAPPGNARVEAEPIRRTAMETTPAAAESDRGPSLDDNSPFFDPPEQPTPARATEPRSTEPAPAGPAADFGGADDPFSTAEPPPAGDSPAFPRQPADDAFSAEGGTRPQFPAGETVPVPRRETSPAGAAPEAALPEPAGQDDAFPPLPGGDSPTSPADEPSPEPAAADSAFPGFPQPAGDNSFPEPVDNGAAPRPAAASPAVPASRETAAPDFGSFSPEPAAASPAGPPREAEDVEIPTAVPRATPRRATEPRAAEPRAADDSGIPGFPEPVETPARPATVDPASPAAAADEPDPAAEPAAADGDDFPPLPGFGPASEPREPAASPEPSPAPEPRATPRPVSEPREPADRPEPGPAGLDGFDEIPPRADDRPQPRPVVPSFDAPPAAPAADQPTPRAVTPRADDSPAATPRIRPVIPSLRREELTGDATIDTSVPRGELQPRLNIEKVAPPNAVLGKPLVYHIIVRNTGRSAARQVTVEDRIPGGTELTGTIPQAELVDKTLHWKLGTIGPNEERKIAVRVVPRKEGQIGSVATVNFVAEVTAATTITSPKLSISLKTPESVHLGDAVRVQFHVENNGTGDASGVVIRSLLPAGLSHADGNDLEYELGSLPAGRSRDVTLTLTAAEVGDAVNRAIVTADGGAKAESQAKVNIIGSRVSVSRRGPKRRYVGREGTWTNVVSNTSRGPVVNATVVEKLPEGFEFVDASADGQYNPARREVSWRIEHLPAGRSTELSLRLKAIGHGVQVSQVRALETSGTHVDISAQTEVTGLPAVSADVLAERGAVAVGERVTFQVNIGNRGTDVARDVRVTVAIPPEFRVIGADGPTRPLNANGQLRFQAIDQVRPGQSSQYKVVLEAVAPAKTRLQVQVQAAHLERPLTTEADVRVFMDTAQ